jgi:hypothetical protein
MVPRAAAAVIAVGFRFFSVCFGGGAICAN